MFDFGKPPYGGEEEQEAEAKSGFYSWYQDMESDGPPGFRV